MLVSLFVWSASPLCLSITCMCLFISLSHYLRTDDHINTHNYSITNVNGGMAPGHHWSISIDILHHQPMYPMPLATTRNPPIFLIRDCNFPCGFVALCEHFVVRYLLQGNLGSTLEECWHPSRYQYIFQGSFGLCPNYSSLGAFLLWFHPMRYE